jgi:hypothetical protein
VPPIGLHPPEDLLRVDLLAAVGLKAGPSCCPATPPAGTPSWAAHTREWAAPAPAAELFAPPALAAHPRYRLVRLLGYGGMGRCGWPSTPGSTGPSR